MMFNFTAGGGLVPTSFSLGNGGTQTFTGVTAGSGYSVSQLFEPGWIITSATCSDGSSPSNIDVSRAENVTCTFVTEQVAAVPALGNGGLLILMLSLLFAAVAVLRVRPSL